MVTESKRIETLPNAQQASSSLDAAIHLWDVDSGQKIRSVENGPMDAWTVTFSPCAEKVVSGSHVGKINMFSTETGQSEQGRTSRSFRRPVCQKICSECRVMV